MPIDRFELWSPERAELGLVAGWRLSLCEAAREAGGMFRSPIRAHRDVQIAGPEADPGRAAEEAAKRARSKCRKYCAANRLNRLGTLTYRGSGCHEPLQLRRDVAAFFRALRVLLGGEPFAYLWTAEWHKSGHGLHVHFAVGRFIPRQLIEQAWSHGFVHIKLLGDLPVGSGAVAEARIAARYLSKYVGKDFDASKMAGLHRYEVAQGYQPQLRTVWGRTREDATVAASRIMQGEPEVIWSSSMARRWQGPPAAWMQWRG